MLHVGTDTMQTFIVPGAALHEELGVSCAVASRQKKLGLRRLGKMEHHCQSPTLAYFNLVPLLTYWCFAKIQLVISLRYQA